MDVEINTHMGIAHVFHVFCTKLDATEMFTPMATVLIAMSCRLLTYLAPVDGCPVPTSLAASQLQASRFQFIPHSANAFLDPPVLPPFAKRVEQTVH